MTLTELIDWVTYLNWDETRVTKLDHYLAQIAAEVRRSIAKNPKSVKQKDFIIQFEAPKPSTVKVKHIKRSIAQRTEKSKSIWAQMLGVKLPKA